MKQSAWVVGGSMTVFLFAALFALHANTALSQTKGNRAPVAAALMSIDEGVYSNKVTVTQGVPVTVRLTARDKGGTGSMDPDGWSTPGKGVAKGGKIEWNSNLLLGKPKYKRTFTNPASPASADMNLGKRIFSLAPGTYTYNMLWITDASGSVSNVGTVTVTVVAKPSLSTNRAPVAVAQMSIDEGAYSDTVTVTQGVPVTVRLTARDKGGTGSMDPDGWNTPGKGVSKGGKIEWNSNLVVGEQPTFAKTITNPPSPASADTNLGKKVFTQAPGTYTYNMLRITDAGGLVSNMGTVTLTVLKGDAPLPSPEPCNAYDEDCGDPNGYDREDPVDEDSGNGQDKNSYDSVASQGSFTATISSPAPGSIVLLGRDVPVAVFGSGLPACGYWTLRTPSGRTITLSAAQFASGNMPGNIPLCKQP